MVDSSKLDSPSKSQSVDPDHLYSNSATDNKALINKVSAASPPTKSTKNGNMVKLRKSARRKSSTVSFSSVEGSNHDDISDNTGLVKVKIEDNVVSLEEASFKAITDNDNAATVTEANSSTTVVTISADGTVVDTDATVADTDATTVADTVAETDTTVSDTDDTVADADDTVAVMNTTKRTKASTRFTKHDVENESSSSALRSFTKPSSSRTRKQEVRPSTSKTSLSAKSVKEEDVVKQENSRVKESISSQKEAQPTQQKGKNEFAG